VLERDLPGSEAGNFWRHEVPACAKQLLLGWRYFPLVLRNIGVNSTSAVRAISRAFLALLATLGPVAGLMIVLLMPFCFWLAPVLALLQIRSREREEKARAQIFNHRFCLVQRVNTRSGA
jgi:hypothetical protein